MIRKYKLTIAYLLVLVMFTVYVALDTFVITRVYGDAYAQTSTSTESAQTSGSSGSDTDSGKSHAGGAGNIRDDQPPHGDLPGRRHRLPCGSSSDIHYVSNARAVVYNQCRQPA